MTSHSDRTRAGIARARRKRMLRVKALDDWRRDGHVSAELLPFLALAHEEKAALLEHVGGVDAATATQAAIIEDVAIARVIELGNLALYSRSMDPEVGGRVITAIRARLQNLQALGLERLEPGSDISDLIEVVEPAQEPESRRDATTADGAEGPDAGP